MQEKQNREDIAKRELEVQLIATEANQLNFGEVF